jgi:hypothetical protein
MSANINVNVLARNMNVRRLAPRVEQFITSGSESYSARARERKRCEKNDVMHSLPPAAQNQHPGLFACLQFSEFDLGMPNPQTNSNKIILGKYFKIF